MNDSIYVENEILHGIADWSNEYKSLEDMKTAIGSTSNDMKKFAKEKNIIIDYYSLTISVAGPLLVLTYTIVGFMK